jgi:peptidoglycan hydrolase-like protein with peptidoglycan-binding domain
MFPRIIFIAFLALLLAGCATTGKNMSTQTKQQLQEQVQELQDRIVFLEEEVQGKDREISELENEFGNTPNTKQKIESTPAKQLSVRQIQTALKNAGFYKGVVDGKLGTQTKSAIKQFQREHGLKADGIVGRRTTIELNKYLNK